MKQLSYPHSIIVDRLGTLYLADSKNDRVMRWLEGAKEETIVVGGNGRGSNLNQFEYPMDFSFNEQSNLYILHHGNYRVQRFTAN